MFDSLFDKVKETRSYITGVFLRTLRKFLRTAFFIEQQIPVAAFVTLIK